MKTSTLPDHLLPCDVVVPFQMGHETPFLRSIRAQDGHPRGEGVHEEQREARPIPSIETAGDNEIFQQKDPG